jgi:hypothetical protein
MCSLHPHSYPARGDSIVTIDIKELHMGQFDDPTTWDNLIIRTCGFCSVQAENNVSITDSTLMHEATEQNVHDCMHECYI